MTPPSHLHTETILSLCNAAHLLSYSPHQKDIYGSLATVPWISPSILHLCSSGAQRSFPCRIGPLNKIPGLINGMQPVTREFELGTGDWFEQQEDGSRGPGAGAGRIKLEMEYMSVEGLREKNTASISRNHDGKVRGIMSKGHRTELPRQR